jgi:hypothetical protein
MKSDFSKTRRNQLALFLLLLIPSSAFTIRTKSKNNMFDIFRPIRYALEKVVAGKSKEQCRYHMHTVWQLRLAVLY